MFEGGKVTKPREAATALAKLLDRELGTTIDPEKLHGFLLTNWGRVSTLAHIVHEDHVRRNTSSAQSSYNTQPQQPF